MEWTLKELRPDFHIPIITNNWLLGFVFFFYIKKTGEGSFSVRRGSNKFELLFSISQSAKDEILMDSIKKFFENLPGAHGSDIVKKSIYEACVRSSSCSSCCCH